MMAKRARSTANILITGGVRLFNRNPWTNERLQLLPRTPVRWYSSDGLWTDHATPFLDDPPFQRAYRRACSAMGTDIGLEWRLHTILWAADHSARLEGAFVECGTAKGFMASGICEYLGWSDRPFYLLDTFEARMPDSTGAQVAPGCDFYATSAAATAANFAEWPGAKTVVGRIPDTLGEVPRQPVAFLHVDLNHPDPESAAVHHFWPLLQQGGVMIFDDYGFPGYQRSRENADQLGRDLGFTVLCLATGQGLVVKR